MEKGKIISTKSLSILVIAGNILFVLFIFVNGINENFEGTIVEKFSYIALIGLLLVNSFLLIRKNKK